MDVNQPRSQWHSFNSYVLVTAGALVGLGNAFQFPFMVKRYGGMFILFYFLCQGLITLPLLYAELLIGRRGKLNPVGSFALLAMEAAHNPAWWRRLGWLCFIIAFLTLCYHTVASAFPMGYFFKSLAGAITHKTTLGRDIVQLDDLMISYYSHLEIGFLTFLALAMLVVSRGIHRGLEAISSITVPTYCLIFLVLAIYLATQGYFSETISHLFNFHPDAPLMEVFLAALALAFLKYKVGMGTMIVYGSYLPYHVSFGRSTLIIVALDAVVSFLAYFIIYPLIIASHANPETLALLSHRTVITLFGGVPHGLTVALFFFLATTLLAWTPLISLAETTVVTLVEYLQISRVKAVAVISIGVILLGTLEVGTHLQWADKTLIGHYKLDNLLKNITVDILTPISAFFIAIFAGWIMKREATGGELDFKEWVYNTWRFLIRWLAPVAIFTVLVTVTALEYSSF